MSDILDQNLRLLEAILFASADPVTEKSLLRRLPDGVEIGALLKELQSHYEGRGVNLVHAGGSWAFRSASDLSNMLNRDIEVARKLGRATIETLAIIAYHQPITRGEIEEVRGVSLSKGTFDALFEHGWIRPRGRRQTPGRPTTWGTTDGFLDHFGLENIKDLPGIEELKSAGLLDKRPAIDAYRISGEVAASAADVAHNDGFENNGDTEADLPLAADLEDDEGAEITDEMQPEPIDPDDGAPEFSDAT
ncbi:MAG: SMC-Scp complex subunit ScpB [Rhodospirillaceae bacterium]|nr:SMC-Scp complex subunit ScpB [Rhodospirillaceae bacterium]MBL6933183.1 SMC-Scp complex subunit ScpB [Rhodospirillales bacterium]